MACVAGSSAGCPCVATPDCRVPRLRYSGLVKWSLTVGRQQEEARTVPPRVYSPCIYWVGRGISGQVLVQARRPILLAAKFSAALRRRERVRPLRCWFVQSMEMAYLYYELACLPVRRGELRFRNPRLVLGLHLQHQPFVWDN